MFWALSLWEIIQSKMNWNTKFSVACEQALYLGERSDPRVSLRLTLARVLFTMPLRWRACSQSQIPCYLQACFLTVYIFCYQTAPLINVNLNTSSFCQKSTNNFFELVYKNFTSLDLLNYQGKRFFQLIRRSKLQQNPDFSNPRIFEPNSSSLYQSNTVFHLWFFESIFFSQRHSKNPIAIELSWLDMRNMHASFSPRLERHSSNCLFSNAKTARMWVLFLAFFQ